MTTAVEPSLVTLSGTPCANKLTQLSKCSAIWRYIGELLAAGQQCFTEFKSLVVWNKANGGMGAFQASRSLICGTG